MRRVTDVAREFRVSKPTAYRVLATFERHGYLAQDVESDGYRLGPKLRPFRALAGGRLDLPFEAKQFMATLRDQTDDTVHLAVLDGAEAVYVAKEESMMPVQVSSRVGSRCPAHCVATGKALFAFAQPALQASLINAGFQRFNELTRCATESIREELAHIRTDGYAVNRGEWRREVRGVAAPVFDFAGEAVAAIGVCSPADRMTDERIGLVTPFVIQAAASLTARLGGRPLLQWPSSLVAAGTISATRNGQESDASR